RYEKSASGYKRSKEKLTILAYGDAFGNHKLKLTVIEKSKNPRAFINVKIKNLPMDSNLFRKWFREDFAPTTKNFLKQKNLPCKARLLLDNSPSHPDLSQLVCDDIKAIFLPPNVISLIQPLGQGVLETLKRY
ncbi:Jerky protein homolog-like, partial [Habropoda laboriosa]